ncbi:MAG TPA: HisA/HisF-related TIM barrel protein, partial [Isosphaeraceae bacterium]|nr:HisA/HisF-related TIM barrel protein [Isosphaeraceae bacterium]
PNLAATAELARRVKTPVIASGGVGSLDDLDRLAGLPLAGCIVGRALYEGKFTLAQAIARAESSSLPEGGR